MNIKKPLPKKYKMNLDYPQIKQNLYAAKAEIYALLEYIESNQSQSDKQFANLEIYTRLADVTTKILQSDCQKLIK